MKRSILFITLISVLLSACTIQKRHYLPGYHVQWNDGAEAKAIKYKQENKKVIDAPLSAYSNSANEQNSLFVASTEQQQIKRIMRKAGQHFKDVQVNSDSTNTKKNDKQEDDYRQPNSSKSPVANSKGSSGKSQLVALLLCWLIGILGIHRFYLGYTGIGIIQLLTLGCCGIWTLVDLVLIIIGDLKPKNGEYSKTLDDL